MLAKILKVMNIVHSNFLDKKMTDVLIPERAVGPLFSVLETHPWPGLLGTPSLCYRDITEYVKIK